MISPLQKTKGITQNARKTKADCVPSFRVWESSLTWPFFEIFQKPTRILTQGRPEQNPTAMVGEREKGFQRKIIA